MPDEPALAIIMMRRLVALYEITECFIMWLCRALENVCSLSETFKLLEFWIVRAKQAGVAQLSSKPASISAVITSPLVNRRLKVLCGGARMNTSIRQGHTSLYCPRMMPCIRRPISRHFVITRTTPASTHLMPRRWCLFPWRNAVCPNIQCMRLYTYLHLVARTQLRAVVWAPWLVEAFLAYRSWHLTPFKSRLRTAWD